MCIFTLRDARSDGVLPSHPEAVRVGAVFAALAVLASVAVIGFSAPASSDPLPCSVSPVLGCVPDIPTLAPPPTLEVPTLTLPTLPPPCSTPGIAGCQRVDTPTPDIPTLPPLTTWDIPTLPPPTTPDIPTLPPPTTPDIPTLPPTLPPDIPTLPPPTTMVPPTATLPPPTVTLPPTPTATPPPTPPPSVPPPTPTQAAAPAGLDLSESAIGPGGDVTARGYGCDPDAPVNLSIGDVSVADAVAGPRGDFQAPLTTGTVAVGRHVVTAECGRTLSAPLDIVLASHVGTGTSTLTVVVLFLFLGVWFYGHRLASHLPARRNHED